jgi:hypothetical protein
MDKKISCLKCVHFQATYDPQAPRSCNIYGFRTASFPSFVVKRETGRECQAYKIKAHFKNKKKDLDLNDKSLW